MNNAAWTKQEVQSFRPRMFDWFRRNARDLPWRHTRDPYRIWVSEVMLQQTRVVAVIDRYTRFIDRFPTLLSLALAEEEDVLTLWSGLGYYKRARLLHEAARLLVREYGGSLPRSSTELRRLPGVGDYTAAAIASIAHGEAVPVVDGNVERVVVRLMRMTSTTGRFSAARLKKAAGMLLDLENPGSFNQAMMELGATVCLPRAPLCGTCPVQEFCRTRGEHAVRPRKQIVSRRSNYVLLRKPIQGHKGHMGVLLVRRPTDARQMPGMWELPPLAEGSESDREPVLRLRHAITQTNYYVEVFAVRSREQGHAELHAGAKWIPEEELDGIPLTGLTRKILMRLDVLKRPRQVRQKRMLPGGEKELP